MPANLRITGGIHTNKKLSIPVSSVTRPAQAVVRESLFNWIGHDLTGKSCLDLFAGTGILSWESMSRGASRAVLVEQHPQACRCLKEQAGIFDYTRDQLLVLRRDVHRWLTRSPKEDFDIIFIDPPYHSDYFQRCLLLLLEKRLLKTGGYVFYEIDRRQHDEIPWLPRPVSGPMSGSIAIPVKNNDEESYGVIKSSRRGNTYFGLIGAI